MYGGDWLIRLSELARGAGKPRQWRVPANVWGLGVTSMLTDVSSEMILSVLPAYLVMTGGLAPLALGFAAGVHEGGPMLAAWAGGLIADRSGRRKLTAGSGYALSALCRLGWLALSERTIAAIAMLVLGDRVGKAIRTAPRDAMISLSVGPGQLATAFGVHRALDAAGAALGPMLAFILLWRLPHRYDVIFFTSFVVSVLGVAALTLLVDESPQRREAGPERIRPSTRDVLAVFGDSSVRPVLILATAFALVTISDAFIYLLLVQRSQAPDRNGYRCCTPERLCRSWRSPFPSATSPTGSADDRSSSSVMSFSSSPTRPRLAASMRGPGTRSRAWRFSAPTTPVPMACWPDWRAASCRPRPGPWVWRGWPRA